MSAPRGLGDPSTFTLGYENNEANGWFDYIVFAVAFSRDG